MHNSLAPRINLRRLILFLSLISAFAALASTFHSGYAVQRQQLIDQTLESSYLYANKLATSTNEFLVSSLQQLHVAAKLLATHMEQPAYLGVEATRLHTQTDSFNSVVITDADGDVLATSPNTLGLIGRRLNTPGIHEALELRQPLISEPYLSTVGNFLVFISQPVFGSDGSFLGTVGGSIYLKQDSILNRLLGTHYYRDGSYLYVVDRHGTILYHPDNVRVGETVQHNATVANLLREQSGSAVITNSRGVEMITGYAVMPLTDWGIVAQRPLTATLAPLDALMRKMLFRTIPFAILIFLVIWWCASKVSQPLQLLANEAGNMEDPNTGNKIKRVQSWYFEAQELKRVMLLGITLLNQKINKLREDAETDPLTRLPNRRSLDTALERSRQTGQGFSIISVDIDHFKRVNDTYGHDAGDAVLQTLAHEMLQSSRHMDLPCRVGGEEFLIFLPNTSKALAGQVAERLRQRIATLEFTTVGHITISLGVACWPEDDADIGAVLKYADRMLYQAKHNGRNRVEVHGQAAPLLHPTGIAS